MGRAVKSQILKMIMRIIMTIHDDSNHGAAAPGGVDIIII